jgi:hypothetical protein
MSKGIPSASMTEMELQISKSIQKPAKFTVPLQISSHLGPLSLAAVPGIQRPSSGIMHRKICLPALLTRKTSSWRYKSSLECTSQFPTKDKHDLNLPGEQELPCLTHLEKKKAFKSRQNKLHRHTWLQPNYTIPAPAPGIHIINNSGSSSLCNYPCRLVPPIIYKLYLCAFAH